MIPGHGRVFAGTEAAIARCRSRLDAFERDPAKNARHVVKVMFVFALLDRGAMRVDELPGYLEAVPCYARMAETFIGQRPRDMAEWVLGDLERAGALAVADGVMRPTMVA